MLYQNPWVKPLLHQRERILIFTKRAPKLLRYIDLARAKNYDLSRLFKCELSEISFFLVKDGMLCKSDNKSELERALGSKLEHTN